MKILIPFYQVNGNNTLDESIITGGIDRFIQSIYLNYKLATIIPVYYNDSDRKARKVTTKVLAAIEHHNPDVLMVNYDSPALIDNVKKVTNIPILWVTHSCAGGIGRISQVEQMKRYVDNGGILSMVSNWQYETMNDLSKRINLAELPLTGGLINPAFATGNEICSTDIEYDLISIGRCNLSKMPFLAHKFAETTGLKSIVHTNLSYENDRDEEYYEKNKHWVEPHITKIKRPHDEVMADLTKSRIYVSSHIAESWGITIFESLVRGLPVIVKTKQELTHAADEICADPRHIKKYKGTLKSDEIKDIVNNFTKLTSSDRIEISEMTKEKHSYKNWETNFSNIIDKTLNTKYKSNNSNLWDL